MLDVKINRDELIKGMTKTQSIAEKRSSMPILSNVLLEAENNLLSITATDLEISFKGTYEAEIVSNGKITVPARKLYEIVHEMDDEQIQLKEIENLNLALSGARSKYQLHGLSPDDFPPMPDWSEVTFLEIDIDILKDMVDKTIYSVSTEETRYNLSGVYMEPAPDSDNSILRFISTDGHRLSLAENKIEGLEKLNLQQGVIVSRKGLVEIRKLLEGEGQIKLGFTSNSLAVVKDEAVLVIRLLEGRFPEYNLVIPKKNESFLKIDRVLFTNMLRRISVMSSERYRGTKFVIEPKNLTLVSVNPDVGEAREDMIIDFDGSELTMGFNVRYFMDILASMNSDSVTVGFNDSKSPCMVTGDEDPGFIGVVMPMNF